MLPHAQSGIDGEAGGVINRHNGLRDLLRSRFACLRMQRQGLAASGLGVRGCIPPVENDHISVGPSSTSTVRVSGFQGLGHLRAPKIEDVGERIDIVDATSAQPGSTQARPVGAPGEAGNSWTLGCCGPRSLHAVDMILTVPGNCGGTFNRDVTRCGQ